MDEIWQVIYEFPDYQVSDLGRIMKSTSGRIMKVSYTRHGVVKVNFTLGGTQHTRSVKVLVAEAFVDGRDETFDTPIHLDGNQHNNRADNLVWRPRWFAWKYARQFSEYTPGQEAGPIRHVETSSLYIDMVEAAVTHGVLIYDVWVSVHTDKPVFPKWDRFVLEK